MGLSHAFDKTTRLLLRIESLLLVFLSFIYIAAALATFPVAPAFMTEQAGYFVVLATWLADELIHIVVSIVLQTALIYAQRAKNNSEQPPKRN